MSWQLTILGANSAVPTLQRYPSGQVLRTGVHHILLDCGEGSQMRMMKYNEKISRISMILISHLHGDHIFGLPGLLTSFNLYHRQNPLLLVGPEGIKDFVEHVIGTTRHDVAFPFEIIEISEDYEIVVFEDDDMVVSSFPLKHRIPTYGYRIEEKINRKYLDKEKISSLNLTHSQIRDLMTGHSISVEDNVYTIEDLERIRQPRIYSYVTDTAFLPECAESVFGSTLIYHESTFLEEDKKLAEERFHSTARQAAMIAQQAEARHLLLGHYSSRYSDIEKFQKEAQSIFPSVFLALSGKKFLIESNGEIIENQDFLMRRTGFRSP